MAGVTDKKGKVHLIPYFDIGSSSLGKKIL